MTQMTQIMPDLALEPETLAEQFIDLGIETSIEVSIEYAQY